MTVRDVFQLELDKRGVVTSDVDPVTGGSIISAADSTLKLPAGETDILKIGTPKYPYPRVWGFYGDSLTFGTGATLPWTFPKLVQDYAGTAGVKLTSVLAGVGGEKLPQIVTRLIANIANIEAAVLLGGTNDALQNYPLERSTQAIKQVAKACRVAGIPLVVVTPPPFYGATFGIAQYQNPVIALRNWIVANAATVGYILVDTWPTIAGGDNLLLAAYQSGDGVHENSECYAAVAKLVSTAVAGYRGVNFVRDAVVSNLCSNPGNAGTAPTPTGATIVGATGTAASWARTIVADSDSILVPGNKWLTIDADASIGNGTLTIAFAGAPITSGNVASLRSKIRITDLSGKTLAAFRANSGYVDFGVGKANVVQGGQFVSDSSLSEIDYRYTSTATTTHTPFLIINLVSGQHIKLEIGDIGLFDMTVNGMV